MNMCSVWQYAGHDAVSNLTVMLATLGVPGFGTRWPALLEVIVLGVLGFSAAHVVTKQALAERAPFPAWRAEA